MRERMGAVVSVHSGDHEDLHKDAFDSVEGISNFSQLPRGTRLLFPSGATLVIEETNPPCKEMGAEIAAAYTTSAGEPAEGKMFPKHSIGLRGVVGVVDVPGSIAAGDRVVVEFPKSDESR